MLWWIWIKCLDVWNLRESKKNHSFWFEWIASIRMGSNRNAVIFTMTEHAENREWNRIACKWQDKQMKWKKSNTHTHTQLYKELCSSLINSIECMHYFVSCHWTNELTKVEKKAFLCRKKLPVLLNGRMIECTHTDTHFYSTERHTNIYWPKQPGHRMAPQSIPNENQQWEQRRRQESFDNHNTTHIT